MRKSEIYDNLGVDEEQLRALDGKEDIIEIFHGLDDEDEEFFAYLAVKPSKYLDYKMKINDQEELELEDYGNILYTKHGSFPNEETQRHMRDEYGIDPDHMNDFNRDIEDLFNER